MIKDIKNTITRSGNMLLQDLFGGAALCVMLAFGLYLPGII